METKSLKVEISVHATPDQGHLSLGFLNSVLISQSWVIEEFFVEESDDGNITSLGSYPDSFSFPDMPSLLRFQDLAPTNVHQQIKSCFNDHVLSRLITDHIVVESRRRDLPQGPLLITVFLRFTKKEYIVMPCNSAPQTTNVEGTCAVCLEDIFLIKWLDRHDSCPLCRQSTNSLTNNPSKALEELGEA
ncbi:hypothetical protein Bca52824_045914 [Brassica carinata]|uniref:Uncharacterized protein n=1 Tax=Brassica carinata TaxID=52824 RepID=A0A8X7RDD9_BRACI|nr:hypothetical protein Bca52824_045914 [Brassica carinata]